MNEEAYRVLKCPMELLPSSPKYLVIVEYSMEEKAQDALGILHEFVISCAIMTHVTKIVDKPSRLFSCHHFVSAGVERFIQAKKKQSAIDPKILYISSSSSSKKASSTKVAPNAFYSSKPRLSFL